MEQGRKKMNREESVRAIKYVKGKTDKILPVTPQQVWIRAELAEKFAGEKYGVRLWGRIYKQKEPSGKWAIILHPNQLDGSIITNNIGYIYYELGYHILAPDLRGFGKSEGRVAMGFLESLDVYDWLKKLHADYKVEQVIVHGLSLGGATVNYLSGLDTFMENGPLKVGKLQALPELHVTRLIVDSSYVGMKQFACKSFFIWSGIGLTKDNFDYYGDASESLRHSKTPMMIIHGKKDYFVKMKNADRIEECVNADCRRWNVEGEGHVFVLLGRKTGEYRDRIREFLE